MATVYKIFSNTPVKQQDGTNKTMVVWTGAEAAAKKARRDMAAMYGLKPLKDIDIETIGLPTSKAGLIEWLNAHHTAE